MRLAKEATINGICSSPTLSLFFMEGRVEGRSLLLIGEGTWSLSLIGERVGSLLLIFGGEIANVLAIPTDVRTGIAAQ